MSALLRIMTYNTRGSLGMDNLRSTPRILETLAPYIPDVVCFQEIHQYLFGGAMENQPKRLGEGLKQKFVYYKTIDYLLGGYGIGLSTSLPIHYVKRHRLPSVKEQRGLLEVGVMQGDGSPFCVFCTHWGLDSQERLRQAERCVEIIHQVTVPFILCGDFNEEEGSLGIRYLKKSLALQDVGAENSLPTFPSDRPTGRIDYMFLSAHWAVQKIEVIRSLASDHLPLYLEVSRET
jgi:endonuclease/exonuclease/phosphatase family metal-dependent hydrolase